MMSLTLVWNPSPLGHDEEQNPILFESKSQQPEDMYKLVGRTEDLKGVVWMTGAVGHNIHESYPVPPFSSYVISIIIKSDGTINLKIISESELSKLYRSRQ